MNLPNHIFITGFMGSGKTTTGKALAEKLGYVFYDLDQMIETSNGVKISRIFAEKGEAGFREIERNALEDFLLKTTDEKFVMSLGGGTVCFFDNLKKIKSKGKLIYLDIPVNIIAERLKNQSEQRPLIANTPVEEVENFVKQMIENRKQFYESADVVVKENDVQKLIASIEFVPGS